MEKKPLMGLGLRRQVAPQVNELCGKFGAQALVFALHALPLPLAQKLLQEKGQSAGACVIAEYRLAERNVDIPAVALCHTLEWLKGQHYAHYKAFMAAGGLEGFAHNAGVHLWARQRALGGAATVALLKW